MSSIINQINALLTWTEIKEKLFTFTESGLYDVIVLCQEGMFTKQTKLNVCIELLCWNELKGRNLVCMIGDK